MSDGLRSRVLGGLAWKVASLVVGQASRLGVAVVLAHLLTPREFGLAAMVLVFAAFVLVFSDLALGAALVQRPSLSEADRSTAYWTSVAVGVLFTVLGVLAAGPIAEFYGEPSLRGLVIALSSTFAITSLGATQQALLVREMAFRRLEPALMGATTVGAAVAIVAAAAGWGAWALILQQVVTASCATLLLWLVSPWRPRLRFSRASLRSLAGFSLNVFGQRLVYYLHRNLDNLLIGRFLGAAALGAYAFAYNIMLVPFSRIAGPLQEVLFPAFSRIQDDRRRMAEIWLRATRLTGVVSIPALVGLAVVAPDFVRVVLGPKWEAAGPVLQILAWVGLLQSLQTLNSNILMALDRTGMLMRFSVVFLAAHLVAFGVGLRWGIVGVAACYAISSTLVEPLYGWLTARALGVSPLSMVWALAGIAQAAAIMGLTVLALRLALVGAGVGPGARLALTVLVGIAVFVPCCAWREPRVPAEIRALLRRGGVPALAT